MSSSSFDLLQHGEVHSNKTMKPLSKKALKKLKRKEKEEIVIVKTLENELTKLYEIDGIWFTIMEFFNFKEIMLVFSLISKRDLNIYNVNSNWCQSFLLLKGMEQFHTLTPKDCNLIFSSLDHKRYFAKLGQHQKQAKKKKPEIEDDTLDTYVERKKTFKRLYQKLWGENNQRVLLLHQTNQAIRSEIQAEFYRLRGVWSSIKTNQFECFHDEFEIKDSLSKEEKKKFTHYKVGYKFTCKKCGLVAISNFMPIFTTFRSFDDRGRLGSSAQEFKLLNIFHQ